MPDLEGSSSLVAMLSSDSDEDQVHALRLSIRGTEVARTSSSEADILRFKNLKRAAPTTIPPLEAILPTTYAHPPIASPSVEIATAVTGII